jgi:integrase
MASLTRKPACKFWIACFTDSTGRQRQRSTRLTDRKAAAKLADTWESLYRRRLTAGQARRVIADVVQEITGENVAGETVVAYLGRWIERKSVETSPSTAHAYKSVSTSFLTHLGERAERMYLDEVTAAHIGAWRDAKAKGRAPATANIALKILRIAFQDALREGIVMQNAAAIVPTIKRRDATSAKRRPFTQPELRRVLKGANDEWRGLVITGLYTGQRLGDLARLTWHNVDLANGQLTFATGKTGRRIALPLAEPLARWLSDHVGDNPDSPLFPHAHECVVKHGRAAQLSREFADLLASVGLAEKRDHKRAKDGRSARHDLSALCFHALRHTATSLLKNAGVSDVVARDIIGHESAAMSKVYTHIDDAAKREAIYKLPDVTK